MRYFVDVIIPVELPQPRKGDDLRGDDGRVSMREKETVMLPWLASKTAALAIICASARESHF